MNRGKAQNLGTLPGWMNAMAELNLRRLKFLTTDDMNATDINHLGSDFRCDLEDAGGRQGGCSS